MRSAVLIATFTVTLTIFASSAAAAPINAEPQFAGGYNQMCLISQMGVLTCMGDNQTGQLGPTNVGSSIQSPTVLGDSAPVTSAGLGVNHLCATITTGAVHCRGQNYYGQLGTAQDVGTNIAHPEPFTPALPAAATAVDANQGYGCAIIAGGAVYCWGTNHEGQLGVTTNGGTYSPNQTPAQVALPAAATKIAVAYFHACAVLVNGQTWCWGFNFYGALGTLANSGSFLRAAPGQADLVGPSPYGISAFGDSTCFVSAARNADCVGLNQYAQLSGTANNGSTTPNPTPTSAPLGGATVVQVAAMTSATCALASTGDVWCYGDNYDGQLGNTTDMNADVAHPTPAKVAGLPAPAVAIGNGFNFICAALNTGAVFCWGNNASGQLGQPSTLAKSGSPVLVPGVNLLDAPAAITLNQGKLKFKFKKSRGRIVASAKIPFTGSVALTAAKCTGKIATVFYTTRTVKKKTKTKRYAKKSFNLGFVKNTCRAKASLKLSTRAKGKKLKFSTTYAGATYVGSADVSPYSKVSSVRVPKKLHK